MQGDIKQLLELCFCLSVSVCPWSFLWSSLQECFLGCHPKCFASCLSDMWRRLRVLLTNRNTPLILQLPWYSFISLSCISVGLMRKGFLVLNLHHSNEASTYGQTFWAHSVCSSEPPSRILHNICCHCVHKNSLSKLKWLQETVISGHYSFKYTVVSSVLKPNELSWYHRQLPSKEPFRHIMFFAFKKTYNWS